MTFDANPSSSVRPLSHWLKLFPPGWTSRHSSTKVDPLEITTEIQAKLHAFIQWLGEPETSRCDTYRLQALSAALFNCYLDEQGQLRQLLSVGADQNPPLDWPCASEGIRVCLAKLREVLQAPFAAYKALRLASTAADMPSSDELRLAELALLAQQEQIALVAARLDSELLRYRAAELLKRGVQVKSGQSASRVPTPQHSLAK